MAASTIIDPKTEKSPKIIVPNFVELTEPSNMPPAAMLEKWHDMANSTTAYKQKDVDPNSYNSKLRFMPNAVIPFHDVANNMVEIKFNVAVVTHKDAHGNWVPHVVDATEDNPNGRHNSFFFPCSQFLDAFVAV